MRETTVLAVVLDTESALEVERLCEVVGIDCLKKLGAHHIHHDRSVLAVGLVAIGRNHHLVDVIVLFFEHDVELSGI